MSQPRNVAVIVGSLRKDSVTRKVARAIEALAPSHLKFDEVPLGDLPLYNQDDDTDHPPAPFVTFRDRVRPADAVLFATPEYNRGLPAVIKNAVDVGSRPYGASVWNGKPAAVISVSPGAIGGFGANQQLRQSMVFLNMPVLQLEAFVSNAFALFDENGELANESTAEFLRVLGQAFSDWIEKILAVESR